MHDAMEVFMWLNVPNVTALCVIFIIIWILNCFQNRHYQFFRNLPGPTIYPIIGNAHKFFGSKQRNNVFWTLVTLINEYSKDGICRLWMAGEGYVFLTKPAPIECILTSTKHISKAREYSFLHEWLGLGLLTSTGSRWHQRRKMLTLSFHFRILDDFVKIFNENSDILLRLLRERSKNDIIFDVVPPVTLCALDIICESAMGRVINAQLQSDSTYVTALNEVGRIVIERTVRPWIHSDCLFHLSSRGRRQKKCLQVLHSFTKQVICERRAIFDQQKVGCVNSENVEKSLGGNARLAFLDLMFESSLDGQTLTDDDIRQEVDTFMFEGHDTTASSISWTLHLLGKFPAEQEKVYEELIAVLGEDHVITSAHLAQLKYLDAVIKESLRIFPVAALVGRRLEEPAVVDGIELPANTNVVVVPYLLHRDPELFPEPQTFDPTRFLTLNEDGNRTKKFSYIPFSAGPRNCIGQKFAQMEEKCVLANVVRAFRIVSHQKSEELRLSAQPILHSANGILVSLQER